MRGIFYVAREISSQLDREFKIPHYNDIKKVYSIWICMNAKENSLNQITLKKEAILEKEFGVDLDHEKKERLAEMCNLGEGIWETALEQGIEQGIEQGKISGIVETCRKLNLSDAEIVEKIKEIMHISEDKARDIVHTFS